WGSGNNLVSELGRLNRLLSEHPCFQDGATLTRLSADDSPIYTFSRSSADGLDRVLVLINTDAEKPQPFGMAIPLIRGLGKPSFDLVSNKPFTRDLSSLFLAPGESLCLSPSSVPAGLSGNEYRISRAQAAWAIKCLSQTRPAEEIGRFDWRELARRVASGPRQFLSSLAVL